jgi:myo-inositol-1(or 4)-monophosphatase
MPATDTAALGPELCDIAATLARRAGALVAEGRRRGTGRVDTKSSLTDLVTEYDRAAERLIVDELTRLRPDDALVGEEGTSRAGTSGVSWFIDPIDGTTNFFYDLPGYAVSIGAADADGGLAGAVYVPALDELYRAARGHGATLNGVPLACSATTVVGQALLATGFSYRAEVREQQMRRLAHMIGSVRDIRRFGAASVDLCFVAAGRVDAYFEEHLNPWDLAAGEIICREAGGVLGDFEGGPARPAQVLAANTALFAPLRDLIAAATARAAEQPFSD